MYEDVKNILETIVAQRLNVAQLAECSPRELERLFGPAGSDEILQGVPDRAPTPAPVVLILWR
ncbi:MAG: hypothetical protein ACOC9E_00850 [Chloroflexota bacterium]